MTYKTKTKEERRAEVEEHIQNLQQGVREYIESNRYKELLDNMTKFHDYSINNTISIVLQKPDATLVASYTKWKSLNRQVSSGEKGIAILCPVKYKVMKEVPLLDKNGKIQQDINGQEIKKQEYQDIVYYKIGYVFDKSQTQQIEGKKEYILDPISELEDEYDGQYEEMMNGIKSISAVPITFESIKSGAKGYYDDKNGKIVINEGMSESQTLKTMFHEIAHARIHGNRWNDDFKSITFEVRECVELPTLGKVYEDLSLDEAIEKLHHLSGSRKLSGIVFKLHDGSIYDDMEQPLIIGDTVQVESINNIEYFRENFEVQKAVMKASIHFKKDMYLRSTEEIQAESIAYICSKHFGLDTSDYSFGYVATWKKDNQQLIDNLNIIKTTSEKMIDDIENQLEHSLLLQNQITTKEDMAKTIDAFMKEIDPYGYADTEEYAGYNYVSILNAVKNGDTEFIQKSLKDIIEENTDNEITHKAQQILKCMNVIQKKALEITNNLVLKRSAGIK